MHLFYIPQRTNHNRHVHISVLNGALWDIKLVHYGIYETGLSHCNHMATKSSIHILDQFNKW